MTISKITSMTNPRIKCLVRLRQSHIRKKEEVTIVEGEREILRAIEAGVIFKEVYGSGPQRVEVSNIPFYETTSDVFSKISYGHRKEGVLAICQTPVCSWRDFLRQAQPLFVVLEHVEKPGNLGAILRTCDGVGVTGVIVCDPGTDLYNPNVIRSSLGTVFSVKVVTASNAKVLDFLKSRNIQICATRPQAKKRYTQVSLTGPLAVVMGSEEQGLSDFWMQKADQNVHIPMKGKADSLNVAASTAVLLYEAIRQRSE